MVPSNNQSITNMSSVQDEVRALKKGKKDLEMQLKDQEEELDDLAAQVQKGRQLDDLAAQVQIKIQLKEEELDDLAAQVQIEIAECLVAQIQIERQS